MSWTLAIGDLFAFFVAVYFSRISHALYYHQNVWYVLGNWWGSLAEINILLYLFLAVLGMLIFQQKGHYARRRVLWDEVGDIIAVFTLLLGLNAAIAFSGKWPLSRLWLFSAWLLALLLVPLGRLLLRWLFLHLRLWNRPVAIIGSGANARDAMQAIQSDPVLGYEVRWILIPEGVEPSQSLLNAGAPALHSLGPKPLETLSDLGNPQVVLALDNKYWGQQESLLRLLGLHYPNLAIAPALRGLPLYGLEVMHFFSHEVFMLRIRDNLARPIPRLIKRSFDLIGSLLLILLLSPVFVAIAWRIRKEDGGPVFFRQTRVGRDGKSFGCLKFRSMVPDAEARLQRYLAENPAIAEEYQRNFKLRDDPRVTRIGRFLRRSSLDELPQLFNVLRGDMSLVGPRPLIARETERYGDNISLYRLVRPGITGLWQISGRSETTFTDRSVLDAWYIKNWTLWYDIVILLRTVRVVLRRDGAY
ncbi:undecaprenyl-phosphate galactose phosphotransferase WbaP [Acidithiobacillus caldus ATCC 51756]|nr:undecaprenyl-phosphate galactose phosphotransferase WbaP [Acidithiobacillus caldus]MBU2736849.1 undecaprenyl-phosphate galactose phosphotransferase WbaP [Acidithiobacillus caldus ATCC 51756]MBU2744374.1 undecaprenyl-phosphate galactose phosphotransferase WbaP [Acidithiobacillus caldus]MBU2779788.1 undecaprenyl-phosphate galactose phosphotransferase WbaP [Acidithiobacillus caldus]